MESILEILKDELTSIGEIIVTIFTLPLGIIEVIAFCFILLSVISGIDKFYNLILDFIKDIRKK